MRLWLQVRTLKIQRIRSICQISRTRPQTNLVNLNLESNSPWQAAGKKEKLDVERRLFVCETTQLTDFVEKINKTSCCSTPDCDGMYRSVDFFQGRYLFAALYLFFAQC